MNELETIRCMAPCEDGVIRLRPIDERDEKTFLFIMGNKPASVQKVLWKNALFAEDAVTFAVDDAKTDMMVGYVTVKYLPMMSSVELGYEIIGNLQGKGYGTRALKEVLKIVALYFPEKKRIARVRADNFISSHIILKLGGVKTGEEPSYFEELIEKYGEEFWGKYEDQLDNVRIWVYEFPT